MLAHESCRAEIPKTAELLGRREELEDQLRYWQQRFKDLSRKTARNGHALPADTEGGATQEVLAGFGIAPGPPLPPRETNGKSSGDASPVDIERTRVKRSVERIRGQLRAVDAEARALERAIDRRFHPYWVRSSRRQRDLELRRSGGGIRVHLHLARLHCCPTHRSVLPRPARAQPHEL